MTPVLWRSTSAERLYLRIRSATAGLILAWWFWLWIPLPVITRSSWSPLRWPAAIALSTSSIASFTYRPCRSMVPGGWRELFSASRQRMLVLQWLGRPGASEPGLSHRRTEEEDKG